MLRITKNRMESNQEPRYCQDNETWHQAFPYHQDEGDYKVDVKPLLNSQQAMNLYSEQIDFISNQVGVHVPNCIDNSYNNNAGRIHHRHHKSHHGSDKYVVGQKEGQIELHATFDFFRGVLVDFSHRRCKGSD